MPTYIFHITHLDNLQFILEDEAIACDASVRRSGREVTNIGYRDLKEKRLRYPVSCGPGGCLGDYAPFYFAPRSPMLYVDYRGGVEGYSGGQEPILHLVASVERVRDAGLRFVFSDGHPVAVVSDMFDSEEHFDKVDWDVMKETYWNDTDADGDRMRRRMAEFLVHDGLPWELVGAIGVFNVEMKAATEAALQEFNHRPPVAVRREWYY